MTSFASTVRHPGSTGFPAKRNDYCLVCRSRITRGQMIHTSGSRPVHLACFESGRRIRNEAERQVHSDHCPKCQERIVSGDVVKTVSGRLLHLACYRDIRADGMGEARRALYRVVKCPQCSAGSGKPCHDDGMPRDEWAHGVCMVTGVNHQARLQAYSRWKCVGGKAGGAADDAIAVIRVFRH